MVNLVADHELDLLLHRTVKRLGDGVPSSPVQIADGAATGAQHKNTLQMQQLRQMLNDRSQQQA